MEDYGDTCLIVLIFIWFFLNRRSNSTEESVTSAWDIDLNIL